MNKWKYGIALGAMSLGSIAVAEDSIGQLFNKLENVNNLTSLECEKMSNNELANLCLQEVCGDPAKHPVYLNANNIKNYDTQESEKIFKDVEKQIQSLMAKSQNNLALAKNALQTLGNLKSPSQLTDKDADELAVQMISMMRKGGGSDISGDGKKINISTSWSSPLNKFNKEVIKKIDLTLHPSLAFFALNADSKTSDYDIYLSQAEKYQKLLAEKGMKSTLNFESMKARALKEKGEGKKMGHDLYRKIIDDAKSRNIQLEPKICNENCKKILVETVQKLKFFNPDEVVKEAAEENKKIDVADVLAECKASIYLNHIKAKDSTALKQEWDKLIERLKNDKKLGFSNHSKGLLLDKIKNDLELELNSPMTTVKKEKSQLQASDFLETDSKYGYEGRDYSQMTPATALELVGYSFSDYSLKKSLVAPRCKATKEAIALNDHVRFFPGLNSGVLSVSPFSCNHVHFGKEIIGHELGHMIGYFIAATPKMSTETKENFQKMRTCSGAEKKTSTEVGRRPYYSQDYITTEEDTADLIGYALSADKDAFVGCTLAFPKAGGYSNIEYNHGTSSNHSPSMQRFLVELQYKNPGKITEACKEVMKRSGAKITKKCF